jgi:protein tyrosine phosphatase (PTP) superfamily phosphohydrolase (DUF442 family)
MRPFAFLIVAILLAALLGCGQSSSSKSEPIAWQDAPRKFISDHVPNAYQVHEKVISGGQPAGDPGFRELAALGVKTIISVDGTTPDVAAASKYGLRYVHLPHGYDGVPASRAQELAKAVRDLPGPIYIHCHHGKHRSPAAAAVACVGAGLIPPAAAELILKTAGTSTGYRGLYQSARAARSLSIQLLDDLKPEFPERARIPPLAGAMVAIEHTHDHLKEIAAAGWKPPAKHPDLDPSHEALLLREHFTELLRTDDTRRQPEPFQELLRDSEAAAQALENDLRAWPANSPATMPPPSLASSLDRITSNCTACHRQFRDAPLSEK